MTELVAEASQDSASDSGQDAGHGDRPERGVPRQKVLPVVELLVEVDAGKASESRHQAERVQYPMELYTFL